MPLIQCGKDGYAPAVIVCVHLLNRETLEWCPIPSGDPEIDHDWLCPDCIERQDSVSDEDLRAICMHCANELRSQVSESECILYCVGMLEELEQLGFAENMDGDRLTDDGRKIYRKLRSSDYKPNDEMMLACLTELTGAEDVAVQIAGIIAKLKEDE